MKVMCRCCHKLFDYDMFMGLCPKCGRVYRRGREAYSQVERDMIGQFHLDGDEGGLNRGIHGVRYNQESEETGKTMLNGFDLRETEMAQTSGYAGPSVQTSKYIQSANQYAAQNPAYQNPANDQVSSVYQNVSSSVTSAAKTVSQKAGTAVNDFRNPYFATNHGTRMNQGVTRGKKNSSASVIIFIVIVVIMIIEALS